MSRIVNDRLNTEKTCSREHGVLIASWVLRAIALCCVLASFASSAQSADLRQVATELAAKYTADLEALAAWCDEQGLSAQAAATRARAKPTDPNVIRVLALPVRKGEASALPTGASKDVAEWHGRLWRLRQEHAKTCFELARKAIHAGQASLAFDLVHVAIAEDPDHEAARRLWGYQDFRGEWHTPYEIAKLRTGHVWDDRFGWIRKAELPRYEKGERLYRGRWISAEEDARLHRNIRNGWDIETEHYLIRTSHSIEAGVRLGKKLEELYGAWRQLFVRYYATQQQVESMFNRRAQRVRLPRHHVVYFRDRQQYNRDLGDAMPNIEKSVGVYIGNMRRAYFFGGRDYDERTLLHEATHQLFHESRPVARGVGESANCWIIEGIAVFMESLRKEGDYYVLGGFDDSRMKAARYRLLVSKFYVPFEELTRYGLPQLQNDPKVATLYSQIAGWTQFLIYYDQGRYRDALVSYLMAVYNGSQDPTLLSRLTGTSYDELDRQYREYMTKRKP
ncbi:MAG: hypothetical protein JW888_11345 [Pirellulales bacterium]|nr:hypothetical protein [Pirellulales bacterium]